MGNGIAGWQAQVRRILHHLNGGPTCTPADLQALHIKLGEPKHPPHPANVEREWDIHLQTRDSKGRFPTHGITKYNQGELMPTYQWTLEATGMFVFEEVHDIVVKFCARILGPRCGGAWKSAIYEPLIVHLRHNENHKRADQVLKWPQPKSKKRNCAISGWSTGKDKALRTASVYLITAPPPGHISAQELFALAAMATDRRLAGENENQNHAEPITVRVLAFHAPSHFRLLTATMPQSYLATLLVSRPSPYNDLTDTIHIAQTPYYNALDQGGLRGLMGAVFEGVDMHSGSVDGGAVQRLATGSGGAKRKFEGEPGEDVKPQHAEIHFKHADVQLRYAGRS